MRFALPTSRRGFTLTEVMIAVVVLGLCLVPLLTSGTTTHKRSHFAEHHILAASRARTILGMVTSLDFAVLDWIVQSSGGTAPIELDLEKLYEPGSMDLLFAAIAGGDARTASFEGKLDHFSHKVTYERISTDLGRVVVTFDWQYSADQGKGNHELVLARLVRRNERSMTRIPPL